ncbi:LTA synthase family protein [Streptococcus cristatus]|uniref:LTA synthase family protein n=1 Tax=Streptococcus cristatus TaxID=45634 RepID=UPI0016598817|nr:alkaline phosphatase family protein [Streptococcus cristatus]
MKFLGDYYEQICFILISCLILDVTAVNINVSSAFRIFTINSPFLIFAMIISGIACWLLGRYISKFLRKETFIAIVVVFFIYILFSYLLEITRNLNDFSYKIWDIDKNHLWQTNSLYLIIPILAFGIINKYILKKGKQEPFKTFNINYQNLSFMETLVVSQLFIIMCLTDSKLPAVMDKLSLFLEFTNTNSEQYIFRLIGFVIYIVLVSTIPSFVLVKGMRDVINNRSSFSVAFTFSALFALIFNYTIQDSIKADVIILDLRLFTGATLFQIIIFFALFLLIYLICNSFLFPTIICIFFGVVTTIANSLKFQFRQEPILPSDLAWLKTPRTLLSYTDGHYGMYILLGISIVTIFYLAVRKYILPNKLIQNFKHRLALILLICSFFASVTGIFSSKKDGRIAENIPVISILNNYHDLTWYGNTINSQLRSLSFVWFSQMSETVMTQPNGYSQSKIRSLEEKYKQLADSINTTRSNLISEQTVVYVLSESFSDPERLSGISITTTPIPNIRDIKSRTTSGLMQSDGYGGGTANMEFQTISGLPYYNLSPSISVLYTEIVPRMNVFPAISDQFESKNRIAIHLAAPTNYSRDIIYKTLGYDKFISLGTSGLSVYRQGENYSDASTYQLVIDNLKKEQNQFFSVITMQNHAPWSESEPSNLMAQGEGFTANENNKLINYTRLLYHTDNATKEFLDKLSKIDKKITVVFYGDHLPGLYPQSAFKDHPENQYLTDYFIWSNYETPKLNYPLVNSSDFSALLLEQTNSKVSPYYALLTEVLHKASVDKKALDSSAQEIADDLKLIEYDMVGGKGYLSKDFFAVPAK